MAVSALAGCAGRPDAPIGKVEVSLEDGRISAAIRTALLNDPDLGVRKIAVESRGGIVSLSGCVRTPEEAQRAQALAETIEGVREVQSALRVDPSSCGARDGAYWCWEAFSTRRSTQIARPMPSHSRPRGLPSA
jgi:hypothetical protein